MKKFLSIILTLTLVMTMLVIPVSAANVEWTVDITSISEGEVFTVGEDILLTADATTLADSVKNIDFYANGSKIPGTVVGNEGSITWYAPCEGVYDISTKVTFSGDNETVNGNETVRIIVLPSTDETRILWAGETDLQVGSKSSTTSSNKYALSPYLSKYWSKPSSLDKNFTLLLSTPSICFICSPRITISSSVTSNSINTCIACASSTVPII